MSRWLRAIDAALSWVENALLTLLLFGTITLSLTSMILRWSGNAVAVLDPLLRYGVLWLGLIGGLAATRSGDHIQVGALFRVIPQQLRPWVQRLLALVSAIVCATIAHASWRFVLDEKAYGTKGFGDIPLWTLELILPIGFAALTVRFLFQVLTPPDAAPESAPLSAGAGPPARPLEGVRGTGSES